MKKVIVVTGASSGFGALAARALAKAGHVVYASMRDTSGRNKGQVQEAAKFAADNKADLRTVELDVLSDTSANSAVKEIIDNNGRLDVVVHNAGHMVFGPLEAFTPEQLAELYDVNVLSTQRVNRAALPQLPGSSNLPSKWTRHRLALRPIARHSNGLNSDLRSAWPFPHSLSRLPSLRPLQSLQVQNADHRTWQILRMQRWPPHFPVISGAAMPK